MTVFPRGREGGWRAVLVVPILTLSCLLMPALSGEARAFTPWWVQTHKETELWSGTDANAVSFGPVPKGAPFLVVAPQEGSRLFIKNPASVGFAYIDAAAVGPATPPRIPPATAAPPSSPAGVQRIPPKTLPGFTPFWVANWLETDFWSGPELWATSYGLVPQFHHFLVIEAQKGDRLKVWSPEADVVGYLDAAAVGPVGPSVWLEPRPLRITRELHLPARSVGNTAYLHNLPVATEETVLRHLPNNTPLAVRQEGVAPDGTRWYTAGDGQYIRANEVRVPTPPPTMLPGRWIDVDLAEPSMVTAYEDGKPVRSALAITGIAATPTLKGQYRILRRVERETMDSSTIGIPRTDPGGYYLKDVLYTQYFTPAGAAIHYNYWLGTFGRPGSHGCLGLNLEDSLWFWEWATVGTPIVIR